jgi:LmbE family N-acetylglucosaminyl deacetylase
MTAPRTMLPFTLPRTGAPLRILCMGAHADDIEIGCGGLVLTLLDWYPGAEVRWVVCSGDAVRAAEARESAGRFLRAAGSRSVTVEGFRDGFFPQQPAVKEFFEGLKGSFAPDLILTHWEGDRHQDHRVLSELAWNTWRRHLILEYEVPKYDGDLGSPNLFVPLAESVAHAKVQHLLEAFASQRQKHWFTEDLFLGLMRLRGMETGGATHYAEGFYLRKAVWGAPAR